MRDKPAIKVLVIDDSAVFRQILVRGLSSDPGIRVVASARDVFEARDRIEDTEPDVVTCDIEMPRMDGIEFVKRLMPQHPLPVIVVSGVSRKVFEALNAGAVDFVSKPDIHSAPDVMAFVQDMIGKVKAASRAKPASGEWTRGGDGEREKDRSRGRDWDGGKDRSGGRDRGGDKDRSRDWDGEKNRSRGKGKDPGRRVPAGRVSPLTVTGDARRRLIAIGASMGGTAALQMLLERLPVESPGIVVVQHIPPVFSRMFAERLDQLTPFRVKEAQTGDRAEPGSVLIAPGGRHIRVRRSVAGFSVDCEAGGKISGHCPSADILFESVAQAAGPDGIGIILTGMGYDGAKGLLALHRKGGATLGQDEASSVVYGMPKAAFELGAVKEQLPLGGMADRIISLVNGRR